MVPVVAVLIKSAAIPVNAQVPTSAISLRVTGKSAARATVENTALVKTATPPAPPPVPELLSDDVEFPPPPPPPTAHAFICVVPLGTVKDVPVVNTT